MCQTSEESRRREARVRGFLATVEEIAADAAKAEFGKLMEPLTVQGRRAAAERAPAPECSFAGCTNWTNLRDGRCDFHPRDVPPGRMVRAGSPEQMAAMQAENRRLRDALDQITLATVAKPGKHLSPDQVQKLRGLYTILGNSPAAGILAETMGWR